MSVENYSEVILRQKHGIEDTLAKIVQDRKVHEVELDNIYAEGVRDLVHPKFLDSLQEKIMKREMTNHNKGQVDAMEWSKHDNSLLERLSGRLEGGDVTPRLHKNLRYTAKRGNSFFLNLNKKLHQDRGIHMRELEQVVDEAKRSGVSSQFVTFLDKTLENRKLYNSRKTALDVAQWEQLDTGVSRLLKNDSQKVLSAGAFPTEISGGFRMTELQKQNYRTAKKLIRGGRINCDVIVNALEDDSVESNEVYQDRLNFAKEHCLEATCKKLEEDGLDMPPDCGGLPRIDDDKEVQYIYEKLRNEDITEKNIHDVLEFYYHEIGGGDPSDHIEDMSKTFDIPIDKIERIWDVQFDFLHSIED
jgi:hypothetical protein